MGLSVAGPIAGAVFSLVRGGEVGWADLFVCPAVKGSRWCGLFPRAEGKEFWATVCGFLCEVSIRSVVVLEDSGPTAGLVSDSIEVCASEDVVGWVATLCWRMVSRSAGVEDGEFECSGGIACAGTSSIFEASLTVSSAGAAEGVCNVSIVARSSTLATG